MILESPGSPEHRLVVVKCSDNFFDGLSHIELRPGESLSQFESQDHTGKLHCTTL